MSNEEKAKDFLNYIAHNEKELKYILAKNITYDKDIFDDVFNDTIIKVYNSILKNGTEVNDYKNYFFTSLKWTYVLADNRNKKYKSNSVRDYFDNNDMIEEETDEEERFTKIVDTIETIKDEIKAKYGEWYTTVFFEYYQSKSTEGCSYQKLAAKLGITVKQIQMIIREIKQFVAEDETINKLKEILHTEDAVFE